MGNGRYGPALRVLRARFGIKQWHLAHKLVWSGTTLYTIETGRRAVSDAERGAIAFAIADLAKLPVEEIVAMLEEEEQRGGKPHA